MNTYTTTSGDQWDIIAKKVYGDERKADMLMAANGQYIDIYQFNSGVKIVCPDLDKKPASGLPPWRK